MQLSEHIAKEWYFGKRALAYKDGIDGDKSHCNDIEYGEMIGADYILLITPGAVEVAYVPGYTTKAQKKGSPCVVQDVYVPLQRLNPDHEHEKRQHEQKAQPKHKERVGGVNSVDYLFDHS